MFRDGCLRSGHRECHGLTTARCWRRYRTSQKVEGRSRQTPKKLVNFTDSSRDKRRIRVAYARTRNSQELSAVVSRYAFEARPDYFAPLFQQE